MELKSLLTLLAAGLLNAPLPAAAGEIAIKAGRMVDTRGGRVLSDQVILIRDDVIVAAGNNILIPQGVRVIDLSDKTVLPGLIDAHTHLVGSSENPDPISELKRSAAERAFESLPNTRRVLLAGFTTVRDLGSYRAFVDVALRDAIERGDVVGPRMLVAGTYITVTGGAGAITGFAPDVILPWDLTFGCADTPDEVRQRVVHLFAPSAVKRAHALRPVLPPPIRPVR